MPGRRPVSAAFYCNCVYTRTREKPQERSSKGRHTCHRVLLQQRIHQYLSFVLKGVSNDVRVGIEEFSDNVLNMFSVFEVEVLEFHDDLGEEGLVSLGFHGQLVGVLLTNNRNHLSPKTYLSIADFLVRSVHYLRHSCNVFLKFLGELLVLGCVLGPPVLHVQSGYGSYLSLRRRI